MLWSGAGFICIIYSKTLHNNNNIHLTLLVQLNTPVSKFEYVFFHNMRKCKKSILLYNCVVNLHIIIFICLYWCS